LRIADSQLSNGRIKLKRAKINPQSAIRKLN
jgi:hypothetical protein